MWHAARSDVIMSLVVYVLSLLETLRNVIFPSLQWLCFRPEAYLGTTKPGYPKQILGHCPFCGNLGIQVLMLSFRSCFIFSLWGGWSLPAIRGYLHLFSWQNWMWITAVIQITSWHYGHLLRYWLLLTGCSLQNFDSGWASSNKLFLQPYVWSSSKIMAWAAITVGWFWCSASQWTVRSPYRTHSSTSVPAGWCSHILCYGAGMGCY